jgi:putative membrane protein
MEILTTNQKNIKKLITVISILIPLIIVLLFQVKFDANFSFLPHIYAVINATTALVLILAIYFIKNGNRKMHELLVKTAFFLSIIFLMMYILYHATSEETKFGGVGPVRYLYFFILITHIISSIFLIPIVLHTYFRAFINDLKGHKKIAPITFLLWEYVAITGVIVYLMISPYYQ